MVERWTFVGSMIQRLQIVWIYGLKRAKQAKYCELKIYCFSVLSGSEKFRKNKLLEMMFSGHITIQYMFCMSVMIKQMSLEGFTSIGEAKYEG